MEMVALRTAVFARRNARSITRDLVQEMATELNISGDEYTVNSAVRRAKEINR